MAENFEKEVLNEKGTVLVDFFADWCGPCKMMAPVLEELQGKHGDVKVCKVNVDKNSDLAAKYGVMSIPTLLVFKDGGLVNQSVGYMPLEDVEKLL